MGAGIISSDIQLPPKRSSVTSRIVSSASDKAAHPYSADNTTQTPELAGKLVIDGRWQDDTRSRQARAAEAAIDKRSWIIVQCGFLSASSRRDYRSVSADRRRPLRQIRRPKSKSPSLCHPSWLVRRSKRPCRSRREGRYALLGTWLKRESCRNQRSLAWHPIDQSGHAAAPSAARRHSLSSAPGHRIVDLREVGGMPSRAMSETSHPARAACCRWFVRPREP